MTMRLQEAVKGRGEYSICMQKMVSGIRYIWERPGWVLKMYASTLVLGDKN